ncbi:MAG: hypothetical protein QOG34_1578 [Frankiaceae bacterium]|nr:hypothetical protein [Frankiaceae bacterium]
MNATTRRRPAARFAVLAIGALLLAGCVPVSATTLVTVTPQQLPCQGYSGVAAYNPVDDVLRDELTVRTFPRVRVGDGRGNIAWTVSPFRSSTWMLWLQSLRWVGSLLNSYEQTGDATLLRHAEVVVDDWIRDHPDDRLWRGQALEARAHRAQTMLCLFADVPKSEVWQRNLLIRALDQHAREFERIYSGDTNHGLDENLALLAIGCTLGRSPYVDFAVDRMAKSMRHTLDAQGVTNEQSMGYQAYNYSRFKTARARAAECGRPLPTALAARIDRMPGVLAAATMPDGTLAQIGDTERGGGGGIVMTSGPRTRIFGAGYVFSRTAWGRAATFAALRFGPARRIHGHDDHMSLTYFTHGRLAVTDAGFTGYDDPARLAYLRSPAASNQLVVDDEPMASVDTTLTRSAVPPGAVFTELRDVPVAGVTRTRGVLLLGGPDLAVVWDRLDSALSHRAVQRWHLLPSTTARSVRPDTVRLLAAKGAWRTDVVQVPVPDVATGRTTVVPDVYAAGLQQWQQTHVVQTIVQGQHVRLLTLLIPAASRDRIRWAVSRSPGGTLTVAITVGDRRAMVGIAPDGSMTRTA